VAGADTFRRQFAIDVRTDTETFGIDSADKTVALTDVATGAVATETDDKPVLAPGASTGGLSRAG
jgi:NADPH-dependent 2,4-dienoyl-CoA reductase/sulfur reductase-like enzyme